MGYYVNIIASTAKIPAANLEEAYGRMCELNTTHDHLKNGGQYSGGKQVKRWFSWMDENYPEKCENAEAILKMLGFETETDEDGNLFITGYDNKTGQEELFFEAIGDLVEGEIEWRGEDGEFWKWVFGDGMETRSGRVVYAGE